MSDFICSCGHERHRHPYANACEQCKCREYHTPGTLRSATVEDLRAEVVRARKKFPANQHMLAALAEEVGELAKELLEDGPRPRVYAEAIQVACVALRIAEEGDADFAKMVGE